LMRGPQAEYAWSAGGIVANTLLCRLAGLGGERLRHMVFVVLIREHRRADLFHPTLGTNDANQVHAGQSQLMFLADVVKVFEMFAGHKWLPSG